MLTGSEGVTSVSDMGLSSPSFLGLSYLTITKREVYRNKLQQNIRDVWSGMKKITGFKQEEDQTHGSLDRSSELNSYFNRFSSETSSAASSPAPRPPILP